MRLYELTYLLSPELSGEEPRILSEKINGFILEEEGKIEKTTIPERRKLAYPIKKKGEAYLVGLNFYLNPEKLKDLEKKLKSENQILRYLILTKKISKKIPATEASSAVKKPLESAKKKAEKPKKVELKDIDKKIDEILKE